MRNMFVRIGFFPDASTVLVDDQGVEQLDEVRILKDEEVTTVMNISPTMS